MKYYIHIISFLVLVLGCKKPFSKDSEAALATPTTTESSSKSVVFIAGYDEDDNAYYTKAKAFFKEKEMVLVDTLFSIDEIIRWLNQNSNDTIRYKEIHIVSHSNPWLGMSLKTIKNGERITTTTLQKAKINQEIQALENGISGSWYNPSRDGEGFSVYTHGLNTEQTASVYWYTYDQQGNPVTYIGQGNVQGSLS